MAKMSTSVQFRRIVWLLEALLAHPQGLTYEELMDDWRHSSYNDYGDEDIPKRTFSDYRNNLEEIFQVNVECDRSTNRYRIADRKMVLSDQYKGRLLSAFATDCMLTSSAKLRQRIMTEAIPSGEEHLLTVLKAMQKQRRLLVEYQKFQDSEPRERVLEPYFLKLFNRRWYMVAKSPKAEGLWVYALDRVVSADITDQPFVCPDKADVNEFFADCFGIEHNLSDYETEDIVLKVYNHHHKCDYLRSLPLHHSQQELDRQADYSLFKVTVYPTYDFMQEILSHGDEIEVLSPQYVREEFQDKIAKMLAHYAK